MQIRQEKEQDFKVVEEMTRQAFWNLYRPGCDQHFLVHLLHNTQRYIKELSLVAVDENKKIVGHIIYTKSAVHYENGQVLETITFGPVTVLPKKQGKGIGTTIIKASLAKAKQLGYKGVIILGHPFFYSRFGFKCSKHFNIKAEDGEYYIGTQAVELQQNYFLKNSQGVFKYDPIFQMKEEDVQAFDKEFPPKDKYPTKSQQVFSIISGAKFGDQVHFQTKDAWNRQKLPE